MQSIGSAAGFCAKHQMDKMFVGSQDATEPTCIKCDAEARPKLGRTQVVEDPGEDYFNGKGTSAKVTTLDASHGGTAINTPLVIRQFGGATLEEIVTNAVLNLNGLPMPKDIKEFKRVQKVIKILQSLTENRNG